VPRCKKCNAEIIWIKMDSGKSMPCNVEKTTIVTRPFKTNTGMVITGHIPHWATCPFADEFRKDTNGKKKKA